MKTEKDLNWQNIKYCMSREINSIIQKVIPILIHSCDISRKSILADASTKKTSPKRGDIWISTEELTKLEKFERGIILLIEVKDEDTKPLRFEEMYLNPKDGDYQLKREFKEAFEQDYEIYTSVNKTQYVSKYKNDRWFDAFIQAKYKSEKQGLSFFAVTNCSQIYFYHTKTLKPLLIKKQKEEVPIDFWIKKSLILELYDNINEENNILQIKKIETVIDNPSEYEFQKFLKKIHNENVFRFGEEKIIDSLLTFVFFKFLQEKMKSSNEPLPIGGIFWEDFVKGAKKGEEGKVIIENMHSQLTLLNDQNSQYKDKYKEFTPLLKVPSDLRTKEENYPVIYDIWKEFSKYNFHGCGFDIYGGIYEVFASPKTKKKFGQYYTRRHISKILSYLTLKDIKDVEEGFRICDPACGTGGLLTECYNVVKDNLIKKYDELPKNKERLLTNKVFYGYDIIQDNIEKAKLNMFFAGDGHTNLKKQDSIKNLPKITKEEDSDGFDVVIANPPYGNGSSWYKQYVTWMNTKRHELVFIECMIKSLKYGGRFGFVVPDGVLENPKWQDFRERLLEQVKIESIISIPVYAFAPYCMQKTYLIIGERRAYNKIRKLTKDKEFEQVAFDKYTIEREKLKDIKEDIWMYVIDFDGFANSNKRFSTDLSMINNKGEIEFIHNDIFELKEKYLKGDDGKGKITKINQLDLNGSRMGELRNKEYVLKKAGFFKLNKDITQKRWYCFLPETFLRPYEPKHISIEDFKKEKDKIEKELKKFLMSLK